MQCWQNIRLVIDAKRCGCHHRSGSLQGVATIHTMHLLVSVPECATPRQAISSNKRMCLKITFRLPSYSYSMKWYSYSYSKIPHRVRVPLSLSTSTSTSTKKPWKTWNGTPRGSNSATSKGEAPLLVATVPRFPRRAGDRTSVFAIGANVFAVGAKKRQSENGLPLESSPGKRGYRSRVTLLLFVRQEIPAVLSHQSLAPFRRC